MTKSARAAKKRVGSQKPTQSVVPDYEFTDGPDAVKLAAAYGLTAEPWQESILDAWLGRTDLGRFACRVLGLAVPRQNGKNAIIEVRELFGMTFLGEKFLHTAHEVKTARKAFLRLASFFEEVPELNDLVKEVRRTNGQEAIMLTNGGSVEFVARSRGSARGFTVDVVILDEAQELNDDHMEALAPTMASSPSGEPQLIMIGTPPQNFALGEVFRRNRENALGGTAKAACWHEWSVQGIGDISDKDRWYATNPALGIRISEEYIEETELNSLSPEGFARERLGWWAERTAGQSAINYLDWEARSTGAVPPGTVSYGIKFSPDGKSVALAVALKPSRDISDQIHVEIIAQKSRDEGITWLADWLADRKEKAAAMVIDGKSGTEALAQALRERGVPAKLIITASTKAAIDANALFVEAIRNDELTHYDQDALNASIKYATKRPIGKDGGFGFAPMVEEVGTTILEAVALAHYGSKTTRRKPGRKAQILWQ